MADRNTYVTVHNLETGESRTFAPDEDLPTWAQDAITNTDVFGEGQDVGEADLIGGEDALMSLTKALLLEAVEAWEIEGVSDSNTKAEIIAAIREAGYDGDGSDLDGQ